MSKELNYRELLTKYMSIVLEAEGVTFVRSYHQQHTSITKEEETELFEIALTIVDEDSESDLIEYVKNKKHK